jgi:hypothetical protein
MRAVWLGLLLTLGGCFLAGYDALSLDDGDAAELPDTGSSIEPGDDDADVSQTPDARADAKVEPPPEKDGEAGVVRDDADVPDAGPKDEGDAALPDAASPDAALADAALPDGTVPTPPDAGFEMDAQANDAAVRDAAADANTPMDASSDARVADGGSDGGCGPSGCVAVTTCSGKTCSNMCSETPDPGSEPTLDCQYICSAATCNSTCSADNTCQADCYASTCRTTCPSRATCWHSCIGTSNCGGDCQTGSSCSFNCTYSTCTAISCAFGATCRISCLYGTCSFSSCGNLLQQSCPDGSLLCAPLGTSC